jgi:outer membrane protein TolC
MLLLWPAAVWAAEPPLAAEDLVALVLENNPRLLAEQSMVEARRRGADAAGSFMDPMIAYSVAPVALVNGDRVNVHQAEIAQTLPWFGKRGLERDMAEAEAGMQAAEVRKTAEELATEARMRYAEWVRLSIVDESLHEQLDRLEDLRRTTLAAIAAGRASQADALMVESEFHMIHEEEIANTAAVKKVEASINALAGRKVAMRLSKELPRAPMAVTVASESPDVQAAARARSQAEAAARLSGKSSLPDVTLFAGVNTMWMDRSEWLMAGFRLDLPLQRGRRAAELEAARAAVSAANRRLAAAELAREEMRGKALARLEEAVERRKLYEHTAIPLAERRLAAARAAYANGQIPIEAVIAALRYDITARSMTKLTQVMEYEANAELAYANGVAAQAGGAQ